MREVTRLVLHGEPAIVPIPGRDVPLLEDDEAVALSWRQIFRLVAIAGPGALRAW